MKATTWSKIWPKGFELERGFSDEQLEFVCSRQFGRRDNILHITSPWLFSASEVYSLGKTFRENTGFPPWLPIAVFSDHGVDFSTELNGPELDNPSRIHLTWSSWKTEDPSSSKEIIRVRHPWVTYRRRLEICQDESAHGGIIFIPHSIPNHPESEFKLESYRDALNKLPSELKPRAIMVGMVDVQSGYYKRYRSFGLPLFSAGNIESPLFVDRFYSIVKSFTFGTSPRIGSQTFYCEELGLTYFRHGPEWVYPKQSRALAPESCHRREALFEKAFELEGLHQESKKKKIVENALGLDSAVLDDSKLAEILWNEVKNPTIYARKLLQLARKTHAKHANND